MQNSSLLMIDFIIIPPLARHVKQFLVTRAFLRRRAAFAAKRFGLMMFKRAGLWYNDA